MLTDEAPARAAIGGWLLVLCLLLLVVEPASFALWASPRLASVTRRGFDAWIVLFIRTAITAFGVAAGLALVRLRPAAPRLGQIALIASGIVTVASLTTPWFSTNVMPGDGPLLVAASIVYYGGWTLYLALSRRVRRTYA